MIGKRGGGAKKWFAKLIYTPVCDPKEKKRNTRMSIYFLGHPILHMK